MRESAKKEKTGKTEKSPEDSCEPGQFRRFLEKLLQEGETRRSHDMLEHIEEMRWEGQGHETTTLIELELKIQVLACSVEIQM